ncbi:MAG: hypothetical protein ACPLTR_05990 [Thermacetogeniaceae bacterium]
MTAIELFARLASLPVDMERRGEELRITAQPGVLTDDLKRSTAEHKQELIELLRQLETLKTNRLLRERGWVLIHSGVLDETVVWCRDETISLPAHLSGLPRYTVAELKALVKQPLPAEDDLKLLHRSKVLFGGTFDV